MKITRFLLVNLMGCGSAVIAASLPPPSAEHGTLPPDVYIEDYYAPPPDFVPQREIRDYTLNTRVPDYFWLRYDGRTRSRSGSAPSRSKKSNSKSRRN